MHPLLPPVFRGKIATTPGRLLVAVGVMFALDLPLMGSLGAGVFMHHFTQVVALIGVLLLASRCWIAALLLAALSVAAVGSLGVSVDAAYALIPLWVGAAVAYPRPFSLRC